MENIIAKVLAGEATQKEVKFVENWKKENQLEFDKYNKAYSINIFESKKFSDTIFKEKTSTLKTTPSRLHLNQNSFILKIAAVFIGIAMIGSLYFYSKSLNVTYTNNRDELAHIVLPDNSSITLAHSSTIKYNKGWFGNFNRKVKLTGKAYFEITKSKVHTFEVLTAQMDVTVLGTKFTVNELSDKTQVLLTEGKVSLTGPAIVTNLVISKPGSQVIVDNNSILKHNIVDNELYVAWLNNKIHFNNCSVSQVINMLYNSYNIELVVDNPELQNKKLFGSAPSDDPELIVDALSYILNTKLVSGKPSN
jgi:ferric-dicitrate binding protein FerR (iron transport regulator)